MNAQDLKNSILKLAIQGKLVEQKEDEGITIELLEQIKVENERMISEKKIKKSKPLPEITEDEIPFDIPESWEWVRLGEIGETNIGLTYKPSNISNNGTIVLRSSNILNGELVYDDIVKVDMSIPENKMCKTGDILICARNGSKRLVGKAAIIDKEGMSFGAFMAIYRSICNEYVLHVINSTFFRNALLPETGTTTINQITQERLRHFILPLPPLEEQKRIVAKVEELMPYVDQYDKAYTEVQALNMKFPADLQKSILQYTITGMLVEHREEEGTAEELYQQIQKEKKKLIKEGKIKKTKELQGITEDEIPFDIPESWKWVRFSEVIDVRDGTHDTPAYVSNGYPLITGKDFYNGYFKLSKTQYVSENDYKEISKRSNVEVGDILFSMIGGNIGSMILIEPQNYFEMAIKNVALFKQYTPCMIMSKYLMYYLKSQVSKMKANASGGAQAFVSLTVLRSYLLPLPPLDEQKRIVEKIEELLPYTKQLVK